MPALRYHAAEDLFDYNGNTTSRTDSTGTTNYAWDFENRLSSVTLPGSGGAVSFKYDPFGRRIYKSSNAGTSVYAYDWGNLIEEVNASGAVIARYSQGLNIDEPLAMLRSATTSYYQADGISSVTSLSNGAGSLAQTYGYDSFGKQTSSSGSLTNPFQFTAREFDPETSLYFYRARFYDPNVGRFLSEDSEEFDAGVNFYRYVYNDPVALNDPTGLSPADVQNILKACQKCTDKLTAGGERRAGSGKRNGILNNLLSLPMGYSGCDRQANLTYGCLDSHPPYDDHWTFSVVSVHGGLHRRVMGLSSNPTDPIVYCDPWLNQGWATRDLPIKGDRTNEEVCLDDLHGCYRLLSRSKDPRSST